MPTRKYIHNLTLLGATSVSLCLCGLVAAVPESATHWAFKPPVRPAIPVVNNPKSKNPIDAFLLSSLMQKGLAFSPQADRRTLLRRVTFDLVGLPPTPAEMDEFLADTSPQAYEKVVDRLLADPRYGERWATFWLDSAGYADSEGVLEEDRIRPNAWRYRDYVIRSLNADKPYNQFLREQIAGDELSDYRHAPKWTPEIEDAVTATGFLRTAVDATRDDFNEHQFTEYQYRMLNDTQTILVSTTLGITLQCARCHDHKYEPLTQRDYYRMQSILSGAIRPKGKLLPTSRRQIVAGSEEDQKNAREVNAQVSAVVKSLDDQENVLVAKYRLELLNAKLPGIPEAERAPLLEAAKLEDAKRTPAQKMLAAKHKVILEVGSDVLAKNFPEFKQAHAEIQQKRLAENKKRILLADIRGLYDQDAAPPPTPLLIRGEWTRPGEMMEPGIPAVLNDPKRPFIIAAPKTGASSTGRRTALADWITRPTNPLTSRVIVNRVWARHFGTGLVPTVENFGRSGTAPTNQPLLDWLATSFASESRVESRESRVGIPESKIESREKVHDQPSTLSSKLSTNAHRLSTPASLLSTLDSRLSTPSLGWSLKRLHRLILLSDAYKQSSGFRLDAAQKDPDNKLLWRQRSRRLEAEAIRDSILDVSGTLDTNMYGEPVGEETRPTGEIVPVGEEKGGRRSIYLLVRRSKPVTLLNTFDAPVMETNCTRRVTSTTPTQALALMNSGFIAAQAKHFAERCVKEGGATPLDRIKFAYVLAFNRTPTTTEQAAAQAFLAAQSPIYLANKKTQADADSASMADLCQALLSSNAFVYVD